MTEVLKSRISDEMISLAAENREYFKSILDVREEHDLTLGIQLTHPKARTETRKLKNGDLEITLTFPLDDNYNREDGRLWVIDRYVFDGQDKTFKKFTFQRQVEYNNLGENKAQWRQWRELMRQKATVSDEKAINFAKNVIQSYSRPILEKQLEGMRAALKWEKETRTDGELHPQSYLLSLHEGIWSKSGLLIKYDDPRNHVTRVERDNAYDIIISYVVNDDDPNTQGHLWVQDKFTFFESDQPIHSSRKITVAKGSPQNEGWEEARRLFYEADGKTLSPDLVLPIEAAQKYFSFLPETSFKRTPDFKALAQAREKDQPEESKQELSLAQFEAAFEKSIDKKTSTSLDEMDPELSKVLQGSVPYLDALKRHVAPEFQWDMESFELKTKVEVQGDKTQVKFLYLFGESTLDGVERGRIVFSENFIFKGKELQEVERNVRQEGPDPEGKLALVQARMQQALINNDFPSKDDPLTKVWVQAITPRIAPHVVEVPGQVPVLEIPDYPMTEDKAKNLRALKEIQNSLIPFLHQPGIDPKYRVKLLTALSAFQYDDAATGIQSLMSYGQDPANPTPQALDPDFNLINNIVFALSVGLTDEAIAQSSQFKSPRIKAIFEAALKPIQRKQLNQEGLEIMSRMVTNRQQVRDYEASRWFGGEDFDLQGAQNLSEALFKKAKARAQKFPDASPFAVLRNLEGLTEAEAGLRDNMLKDPLFRSVNSIAQETDQEIQAKELYNFARSDLMEAKLSGAAAYLAQFVATDKMPPTASLTSVQVIEKFAESQFKQALSKRLESHVGEKGQWLKWLTDPEAMSKLTEQELADFQKNLFETYGEDLQKLKFQMISEDPQYGALMMMVSAGDSLFNKSLGSIQAQPEMDFETVLRGLEGLDEAESQIRQTFLNDPRAKKILAANKIADLEQRHQAYGDLIMEFSNDPELAPLVQELIPLIQQGQFPEQRGIEGAFLINHFFLGAPRQMVTQTDMAMLTQVMMPDIEKEQQEALKSIQKDMAIERAAQQEILAKVEVLAASRPHADPVDLLEGLTDEKLDTELSELKSQWTNPTEDQKATLAYLEKLYPAMKVARDQLVKNPMIQEVGDLGKEIDPFKRRDGYKAIFTRIQGKAGVASQMMMLGQIPDPAKRKELAKKLAATEGLSEETKKNIKILGETQDPKAFETAMKALQDSSDFKDISYLEPVLGLSSQLEMGQLVRATPHEAVRYAPGVSEEDKQKQLAQMGPEDQTAQDIQKFLSYAEGRGDFGTKMEYMTPTIMHELTKPTTLAAMYLAGWAGPLAESAGLTAVTRFGLSGRKLWIGSQLAKVGGIAVEGATFTTTAKLGESSFYGSKGQWDRYYQDVGASILTFGALRLGHAGSNLVSQKLIATGRLGKWAGGPVKAGELSSTLSPLGRIQVARPMANGTVPTLTKAGQRMSGVLNHGAGIGGMYLSHDLAKWAGWAKENPQGWEGQMADTIIMYTQAVAMFGMINSATGGRYQQRIAEIRHGNQIKMDMARIQAAQPGKVEPALVDRVIGKAKGVFGKPGKGIEGKVPPTLVDAQTLLALKGKIKGASFEIKKLDKAEAKKELVEMLGHEKANLIKVRLKDGEVEFKDTRKDVPPDQVFTWGDQTIPPGKWMRVEMGLLIQNKFIREYKSQTGATQGELIEVRLQGDAIEIRDNRTVIGPEESLSVEGKLIKPGEWVRISPDYTLELYGDHPSFRILPFYEKLAEVPKTEQLTLSRKLDGAKDFPSLLKSLDKVSGEGGPMLSRWIGEAIAGKRSLEVLPVALNLRANVERLMATEVETFHHLGLTRDRFRLKDQFEDVELTGVQKEYLVGTLARGMAKRMGQAKDTAEMIEILVKSPFETIDGRSMLEWGEAIAHGKVDSGAMGVRQRLKDIADPRLRDEEAPAEPSKAEEHLLKTLVGRHLDARKAESYAEAQETLRLQMDALTPEIKVLFLRGYLQGPRAKRQKALLDAYFGPEGSREMPSAGRGHEIATLLGRAGLSESFSLIEKSNDRGILEWHLVRGESEAGWPLVKTRALKKGEKLQADGIFYSTQELSDLVPQIGVQLARNQSKATSKIAKGEVRSVVMHPWGASEYRFKVDAEGTTSLAIQYSLRPGKARHAEAAEAQLQKIRDMDWDTLGVSEINVTHVKKFSEFLDGLEYQHGLPTIMQSVSGSLPNRVIKPHWAKIPELKLRRGKKGEDSKTKPEKNKNEKVTEDSETKTERVDEDKEESEPAKEETEPVTEPNGSQAVHEATTASVDNNKANLDRIKMEASSRVQESLRQKFQELEQNGEKITDGENVQILINAGEATMKPSHMDYAVELKFSYDQNLQSFRLTESNARDLENAQSHSIDPEIRAFYEGILVYKDVSMGLF